MSTFDGNVIVALAAATPIFLLPTAGCSPKPLPPTANEIAQVDLIMERIKVEQDKSDLDRQNKINGSKIHYK